MLYNIYLLPIFLIFDDIYWSYVAVHLFSFYLLFF